MNDNRLLHFQGSQPQHAAQANMQDVLSFFKHIFCRIQIGQQALADDPRFDSYNGLDRRHTIGIKQISEAQPPLCMLLDV